MKNQKTLSLQIQHPSKIETDETSQINPLESSPSNSMDIKFYDEICLDDQVVKDEQREPLASQIKNKITHFIGHLHEAPDFSIDSEYILTGYRINFSSSKKVLKR